MAKKQSPKMVNCRYPKCRKLHESTQLPKEDAVQGGKQKHYYHPDCYHVMQTVNEIRDLFYKHIDQTLTGKQIGGLVSTINYLVLDKHVDVDYLKFALQYFINYKPGKLNHPPGLHYIIQDKDVKDAWDKEQEWKIRNQLKQQEEVFLANEFELDLPDLDTEKIPESKTTNNKKSRFSSVLGV